MANLGERAQAIEAFAPILSAYPTGLDIATFLADTRTVERQVYSRYSFSHRSDFLFRYYGATVLPKIIPDLQTVHARINFEPVSIDLLEADPIPLEIQGYPSDAIIMSTAKTILKRTAMRHQNKQINRLQLVDGLCGSISRKVVQNLVKGMPGLTPELTRVEGDASRPSGSAVRPHVLPLGMGHSAVRLAVLNNMSTPERFLHIDPTIAQVDQTDDYDIEFSMVPGDSYEDFFRLHYGAYPNSKIHIFPAEVC